MNQITERSAKADIIDAAIELTETQAELIDELKERQLFLFKVIGALLVVSVIF